MYSVPANFHTLAIADSPKTRCRIYFITDAVNCWDDNDVQTNGTLLVGAAGDTDSNGRIGQGGVTVTEIFNKDKNLTIGGTVSYQIGMTLVNSDGALNNFAFGRCKVYIDVWDDTAQDWLACPMGVYKIDLPVKRRVQLISCSGYDQMQVLNAIADTWWNGLNFTGGLTIESILNSMVTQLGLRLSATSSTSMVNKTLSFTTPPIDSVERTYRDILGWIAEATGTVAHFNRDGELDMRQYLTPQIGGNNIVIDTDTTGNQCLSIDVAEYSVSQIDALTIKLTTADQGVTVGSGTNVYTIMDNPFLYGPDVATIQGKLTPIYNRLSAYATYSPISTRLIYDWSIEAGDIIYIRNNSTTYNMPIFQQKMTWRGGYVTSELISSGDTVRPQVSSSERETYRYNVEMATKVGDNEIISKINQTAEQIQIQASKVNLTGYVTFTNLSTDGETSISGGNIITETITADKLNADNINASKTLTVGAMTDAAAATVLNSNIAIGGRNLCTGTAVPNEFTKSPNGNWFLPVGAWPISTYGGAAFADTANTQWTASFDYSITGVNVPFTLEISPRTSESAYSGRIYVASIPVGSSSGHAEGTGTITDGARDYAGTSGVAFFGIDDTNANAVLTVRNLKFEIGNKATSWTQAPEDVAADIATAQSTAEGANSQEQLIYISKVSGTTSVSGTTTWVTNTTGNQNTWTIKRPVYDSSYPVLFVATQRKSVGGTVTCTTPQIDQTTTVIDGGHITTGTIDAGVVNVTNINASNITSGELSANRISGGTLTVGGQNNTNGEITILDSYGNLCGTINNNGVKTLQRENGRLNTLSIGGGYMHLQTGGSTAAILNRTTTGAAIMQLNDSSGRTRAEIYGDYGRYIQYFGDTDNHISTDLGNDTTRSFLTLNSPDGSSDIFLDTLPANGSRFNSPTTFNAAVTMNSTLDVTPRRCYASLSQAGWYRVMKVSSNTGDWSYAVDFCITRSYSNTDNEVHTVKMLLTYGTAPSFVNEDSKSNNLSVTAIRYTVNSNGVGYVDIRYDANSANTVAVDFTVHTVPSQQPYFTAENMTSMGTADPPNETVLTVYTFAANTGMRVVHAQSSTSFGDAIATIKDIIGDNGITWGGNAANNLHAGISGFSNGVVSVGSSGGPQFFATLGKYSANYYAAEIYTYNYPWRIRIRNVNGTYHAELYYPNY